MILYILLIAYLSPIFAGNEIVKPSPMEASRPLGSVFQPLPQMNIDTDYAEGVLQNTQPYNVFYSRLGNIKDISQYCPHTDILSMLLNTLSSQPQGDAKIRAALTNYYNLLTNALNQRQSNGILNNYVNDYQINDINSLAQNILMHKNNNVRVKISFQYDLPEIQRNKCEQLCMALEKYSNMYSGIVNHNYYDRNALKNYESLILPNQRPLNTYPSYPSNLLDNQFKRPLPNILPDNYLPNLEPLLNPQNAKLPNLNPLQELFPPLPNQNPLPNILPMPQDQNSIPTPNIQTIPTENSRYNPANNLLPLLQNPTNSYPVTNLGPSLTPPSLLYWPPESNPLKYPMNMLPNPNENSYPLQDIYPQNNKDIPGLNPLQYLEPSIQDQTKPSNGNLQQLLAPEEPYPQFSPTRMPIQLNVNPLQNILPVYPRDTDNQNALQNILSSLQNQRESQNVYLSQNILPLSQKLPENNNFYPLQNLEPFPQNPNSDNSISIPNLPSLPSNPTPSVNYNSLQNLIPLLPRPTNPSYPTTYIQPSKLNQNLVIPDQNLPLSPQYSIETDNLLQNLSQSLQSYSGNSKSFQEYVNSMNQKYLDIENYQNQNSLKNYNLNLDLTKYRDQESDILSLNKYRQNDILLNQNLNQMYENAQQANSITENPALSYLANLNSQLSTNTLSNINQEQSADIKMDSLSESQSNSYNYFNRYTDLNKGMYPQSEPLITNPYNLNIQDATKNYLPSSLVLNRALQNALYNSYQKNLNQLQRNTYNRFLQMPNTYYNSNFNFANSDKTTQNYNVQLEHLHRLLAVSNLYKLNSVPNKNGIVELTYKLKQYKPIYDPYYYVKYRLPYQTFLYNLKNLLVKVPNLRNNPNQDILLGSNISEASKDLKKVNKDELFKLIANNGTLITAKLIEPNHTDLDENVKIVQKLNSNIPFLDIIKANADAPRRYNEIKSPLDNYMRAQENYLKHLQKKLPNSHNLNPYFINPMSSNQNRQHPSFLSFKNPKYNSLMAPKNPAHVVLNNNHPRNIL